MPGKPLLESVIDENLELTDPNPDINKLFETFNKKYFRNKLKNVNISWSSRMVVTAGICKFFPPKECSIQLSNPLLKFRPRRDLVETLLHEMIHAYLYIVDGDKEREEHGPKFISNMERINLLSGANITVFHEFHEEIAYYQSHWWMCTGECSNVAPNYGIIMKSINRNPGPWDYWWDDHLNTCKGTFIKIKEPEKRQQKRKRNSLSKPLVNQRQLKGTNNENVKPKRNSTSLFSSKSHLETPEFATVYQGDATRNTKPKLVPVHRKSRRASINTNQTVLGPKYRKRSYSMCQEAELSHKDSNKQSPSGDMETPRKICKMGSSPFKSAMLSESGNMEPFNLSLSIMNQLTIVDMEDDNVFLSEQLNDVSYTGVSVCKGNEGTPGSTQFQENTSASFNLVSKIPCPICRTYISCNSMPSHIEHCLSRFNIRRP